MTLLLVEDDSEVRSVLSELLKLDGIDAVEAADGLEAWTILDSERERARLNLVLSDIAMPRLNGFQLLDRIRADNRFARLPVVLTSGNTDRARADLQSGAARSEPDAFFPKPFDFAKLIDTIRALVKAAS